MELESQDPRQPSNRNGNFTANALKASLVAVGVMVGVMGLIGAERHGLVESSANNFVGASALHGETHTPSKFTTAACYGDGPLCMALLAGFNPKLFTLISETQRKGRMLFAPGGMTVPKTATRSAPAVPVGVSRPLAGGMAQPGSRAAAFPRQATMGARAPRSVALQMSVGLYYSTTTGNTETVAGYISDLIGVEAQDPADVTKDDVMAHDAIIVGAPTWHTGADTERSGTSWDEWLYNELPNMDLTGKKVAIFGVGDSSGYGENFCDATGELYDCFTKQGAKVYGMTSADDGFDYEESKGVVDGKFVGMPFDEDNYSDESEKRAGAWVEQLRKEEFDPLVKRV